MDTQHDAMMPANVSDADIFTEMAPETSTLLQALAATFAQERRAYVASHTTPDWQDADDALAALIATQNAMPDAYKASLNGAIADAEQKRDAAAGTVASTFDKYAASAMRMFMQAAIPNAPRTAQARENAGAPSGRPTNAAAKARRTAYTRAELEADPSIELIGAFGCDTEGCEVAPVLARGFLRKPQMADFLVAAQCDNGCREEGAEALKLYSVRANLRSLARQ